MFENMSGVAVLLILVRPAVQYQYLSEGMRVEKA
jgi:hypothetical protein